MALHEAGHAIAYEVKLELLCEPQQICPASIGNFVALPEQRNAQVTSWAG